MKNNNQFKKNGKIKYNDGRVGHIDAIARILSVSEFAMIVQFEDRADVTTIRFNDANWMNFISAI